MTAAAFTTVRRYGIGRWTIAVEIADAATARWLDGSLLPAFRPAAGVEPAASVHLIESAEEHAQLEQQFAEGAVDVPCFALDRRVVALPSCATGAGRAVLDPYGACIFHIAGPRIDVVTAPPAFRARTSLLRIVRELLVAMSERSPTLLDLHAAAFEIGGRAILLAGARYSGKTTLLCHALASGATRLLANDRVFVDLSSPPPMVRGIPTLVSIRPQTAALFPAAKGDEADGPGEPFSLGPLAARLGTSCVERAQLDTVLFPEVAPDAHGCELAELAAEDGLTRLRQRVYGSHRDLAVRTLFEEICGTMPRPIDWAAVVVPALAGTRFFSCRLGSDAYADNARRWIDTILGRQPARV